MTENKGLKNTVIIHLMLFYVPIDLIRKDYSLLIRYSGASNFNLCQVLRARKKEMTEWLFGKKGE